jgi:hypothetical protein
MKYNFRKRIILTSNFQYKILVKQIRIQDTYHIVTDLINVLPGNSSVNMVQHATIEEVAFSVDVTNTPIDWLDSDHMICVYSRSMSVPRLYKKEWQNSFRAVRRSSSSSRM